ncbi:MAG: PAS domain S-box protein [Anaerolineae bacterium]|nr:PAS domain S-box protein [Anaerolineae bacterium]
MVSPGRGPERRNINTLLAAGELRTSYITTTEMGVRELKGLRADGSTFDVAINAGILRDEANVPLGMIYVGRDITDKKRAEEILRNNEQRYRALFDRTNDAVFLLDLNGRHLAVNNVAASMLGYSTEELLSLDYQTIVAQEEHDRSRDVLHRLLAGESIPTYERLFRHRSGRVFPVELTVQLVYDGDGHPMHIQSVARDITERKRAEEEIVRSRDHLQQLKEDVEAILTHSSDAILVTRPDGTIAQTNLAFDELFGYSPDELYGQSVSRLAAPQSAAQLQAQLEQILKDRQPTRVELLAQRRDGNIFDADVALSLVTQDPAPLRLLFSLRDITERKRVEEALREARDAAEAANRAKSIFLANMSHELRTPMNAILGFAEVLERSPRLTEQDREHLGIISSSGSHLLNLLNDILEMSKIEAGRTELHLTSFDVLRQVESIVQMFQVRAQAKQLYLRLKLEPDVPRFIRADEGKLRQILINLLSNAVKFTEQGGVELRVSFGQQPHPALIFEVDDTGQGIAEDEQEGLFMPFGQTRSGLASQQGTGLGLAITRQFIRMMGGHISLQSVPNLGTLFMFDAQVDVVDPEDVQPPEEARTVVALAAGSQREWRILVVDDMPDNLRLVQEQLQAVGLLVRAARNGQEALDLAQSWAPHLIWMDMRMPVMDGYEATRRIKALPGGPQMVIIALTASSMEGERIRILETGCDDYVRKPMRAATLFEKLRQHLGIEFIYSDLKGLADSEDAAPAPREALSVPALAALDPAWLIQMEQAAIAIDRERIYDLLTDIEAHHPKVAESIRDIVKQYRFDTLQAMVQKALA